ncbi:MAG: SDR family oxidoreductase [Rhodobacter sp.]|nr:SDR family oxidoreductase [Rhodobacter sp.]
MSDPDAPAQVVAAAKDKAGLHGLNCAVAVDQGTAGVRCTAAAPGWIDMLLNDDFAASMPDHAGFRGRIGGLRPLRRTGKPFDVAQLIAWLGLAVAAWITGQAWTIDGGRMPQSSLP